MTKKRASVGKGRETAWAITSLALLLCPALASAQSFAGPFADRALTNRPAKKLTCAYKDVMSDAQIVACTGHPVHYNYTPIQETPLSMDHAASK